MAVLKCRCTNDCQEWNRTEIRNGCEVCASTERTGPNRRELTRRIQSDTDEIRAILKHRRVHRRHIIWQSDILDSQWHESSRKCSRYRGNRASGMKDDGVEGWTGDGGCIQIRNAGYIQKQRCESRKSIEHARRRQRRNGRR